jgi:hypothetical protein
MPEERPIRMWRGEKDSPPIPWSEVEQRLRDAIVYWAVTAAGARPVWGAWLDDRLLLSIGSTVVTRGIDESPAVSVHLEDGHDVVIVEGTASWVTDADVLARYFEVYNPKYDWDFTPEKTVGGFAELRPTVVLAWKAAHYTEKDASFPLAASRFTF